MSASIVRHAHFFSTDSVGAGIFTAPSTSQKSFWYENQTVRRIGHRVRHVGSVHAQQAGTYRLTNTFTGPGKCLDIVNDGRNNQLNLAACGNYSGQQWVMTDRDAQGYQAMRTEFTGAGMCLDVVNDGRNDRLNMASCGNFTGQRWHAEPAGNGYVRLKTQFTGQNRCLDVVNDGPNDKVRMAPCGNFSGQLWKLDRN
jgi:hypothetical protein